MKASTRLAVAGVPGPGHEDPAQSLRLPVAVERGAFHLLQLDPNAGRVQVVHDRFGDRREARDRGELAGVDPVRIAGLGEQPFGFCRIVGRRRDLQGIVHDPGNDHARRRAEAETARIADRLAIERVIGR